MQLMLAWALLAAVQLGLPMVGSAPEPETPPRLDGHVALAVAGSGASESDQASSADPVDRPSGLPLVNSVTQPGLVAWNEASTAGAYAREGALVVAGRTNYDSAEMKAVSRAGGTVLVYLDAIIDAKYGRYHQMLLDASVCGAAVPRWPGDVRANSWGYLNDFRPGSILQSKLECVLEKLVTENPHIAGFFADDLGSRSYFPGFDWSTFGASNQAAYRAGAIEIAKTFRKVSDNHRLIFLVNGSWGAGSLASAGGGYPDMNQHGLSIADGAFAEHHNYDDFWGKSYPCSRQWASQSSVTQGKAFNFAVPNTAADRVRYAATGCYAFASQQSTAGVTEPVWGPFIRTGLPSSASF